MSKQRTQGGDQAISPSSNWQSLIPGRAIPLFHRSSPHTEKVLLTSGAHPSFLSFFLLFVYVVLIVIFPLTSDFRHF